MMNIVTAYTDTGIALGQITVDSKSNEIPAYEAYKVEGDNAAPPIVRGPSKREIKKNPPNRKAMVNTNHQLVILSGGISIPPSK